MGKHPMPNRNRVLLYLGGETVTSVWPVIRYQAGLRCVAEAAVLDDSRLIVQVEDHALRVVCNYMVWVKCGPRSPDGDVSLVVVALAARP